MEIDEDAYRRLISLCKKVKKENDYLAKQIRELEDKVSVLKKEVDHDFQIAICLTVLRGGEA